MLKQQSRNKLSQRKTKTKTQKIVKNKIHRSQKRSFISTNALPTSTQSHVSRFLPSTPSKQPCNDLSNEQISTLFSSKLPHTTRSLQKMEHFIMNLQSSLVSHIEALESELTPASQLQSSLESTNLTNIPLIKSSTQIPRPKFSIERTSRDSSSGMLGGGVVAVLQGGNIFEKAGCNTSVIHGMMPIDRLHNMRADHQGLTQVLTTLTDEEKAKGLPFSVAGISLVFHPHNPHQPTVHANYRMFQVHTKKNQNDQDNNDGIYWFGGGSDLTPTYIEKTGDNSQYGKHFHNVLKTVLDTKQLEYGSKLQLNDKKRGTSNNFYNFTKQWCDEYFYLPHRNETRGLGGIFYDDFDSHSTGLSQSQMFDLVTTLGDSFAASYFPLIVANATKTFTPEEKQFQQLRRGRYVEFNVMYDRGTKFGLQMPSTAAIRVEQILMSLPLTARYEYCHTPQIGSPEANTLEILRNPISWVD